MADNLEVKMKQAIEDSGISGQVSAWYIIQSLPDKLRMCREELKMLQAYSSGEKIEFEQYKQIARIFP